MTEAQSPLPTRLLDDPNLSASLRGDLELAQASPPVAYDVQAGLARFEQSLATPAAGGSTLAGAAGLRVLGWLLGASVLIGGSMGAAKVITQTPSERPTTAVAPRIDIEPEDAPVAGIASSVTRDPVAEVEAPPASAASGEVASLGGPEPSRPVADLVADSAADSSTKPKPEPAPAPIDEAMQINEARKALEHDPAKALALVEALEQQVPNGAMIQERRGYAILALVALGRTSEAEQRADSYLQRWPNGTLSRRIRDALGR